MFKWLGIVLGSLVSLILLVLLGFYINANIRLHKAYSVQAEAITIPTDPESIERGKQWVTSGVCMYCHGSDLAGTAFLDDPMIGSIPAPNLTSGTGGTGHEFTDDDWYVPSVMALPGGKSLIIMPSSHFYYFSDGGLGDIIAYLKSLPLVDRAWPEPEFTVLGKILVGAGVMGDAIEAEKIDRGAVRPSDPMEGLTAAYGDYLTTVSGCRMCHGEDLTGDLNPQPCLASVPGPSRQRSGFLVRCRLYQNDPHGCSPLRPSPDGIHALEGIQEHER